MTHITELHARRIFDSRGNPTVEVDVTLADGTVGTAAVPSGASTGALEAIELRDGGEPYGGKGVSAAIGNVNGEIRGAVRGFRSGDQPGLDRLLVSLDGTDNKSRLGANAILGVSMAYARACAAHCGLQLWQYLQPDGGTPLLPMPMLNVLNGGVHARNGIDFQEYLVIPVAARSFTQAMRMASETYHALQAELRARGLPTAVGDEGGFAPALGSNEAPIELLVAAIGRAGFTAGADIAIALDPATSEFHDAGGYHLRADALTRTSEEFAEYWSGVVDRYPIVSLEDPMAQDDWSGWTALTARLAARVQIIADDIFVTNPAIIRRGIDAGIANAVLIKPNQIGTVSETLEAIDLSHGAGYRCVISHRSGETEDTFIADLAVATGVGQIKTGAPARTERVAKYNRLLRIEEQLGAGAELASVPVPLM